MGTGSDSRERELVEKIIKIFTFKMKSVWLKFLIWLGYRSPCCGAKTWYWDWNNENCCKCGKRVYRNKKT